MHMLKAQNERRPGNSVWVWGVLPAIFAIAVLWYPFGLSLGGMLEEYDILRLINLNPGFWNSFPGHILSELFAARPLQVLPHAIAHQLSPHSFAGFHILLMVACFLRVVGGASIGYFLFRNRLFAAATGLLFLVLPADTQQFHFRTMHICLAVGMLVFGNACLIRALLIKGSARRFTLVLVGTALCVVGVLIYEPVFTLYALLPVALAIRYGVLRAFRVLWRNRGIAFLWAVGPVVNIAYLFYAIVIFKSSYQVNASQGSMSKSILHNLHYLVDSAAYRVFVDTWISAFQILTQRTVHFGYLGAVFVALLLIFIYFAGERRSTLRFGRFLRFMLGGLVLCVAGYLPFMVAETHMVITQRTFIAVAPGASLIVVALIQALSRRANLVAAVLAACVVTLGIVAQLYQFDLYTRTYTTVVRPYLSQVADKSDPAKHIHLVLDSSGFGGYLNGIYFSKIMYGPGVRRGESGDTYVPCEDSEQTSMIGFSRCALSDGTWSVSNGKGGNLRYPANQVDVIKMGKNFDASYRSSSPDWHDLGHYTASQSMFTSSSGASREAYSCVADSSWGYSDYCRGMGWSDGIFTHGGFFHKTFFAATASRASLIFNLAPAAAPYQLVIDMFGDNSSSLGDLTLQLNGSPLDFKVSQGRFLVAAVPLTLLKDGQNELVFNGAIAKGRPLGFSVTSVTLAPVNSKLLSAYDADLSPAKIASNQWIGVNSPEATKMMASGFSGVEPDGRWTDGKKAVIEFQLPQGTSARTFIAEVAPFLDDRHTHVEVDVAVNGVPALHKAFVSPAQREALEVPLGAGDNNSGGPVNLTFTITDPAKPQSTDNRDLGFFFYRFKVQ